MSSDTSPNSIIEAKAQAKRLRTKLSEGGMDISHSKSLELVAQQHGHRDWNSMFASFGNKPAITWQVGQQVTGRYLSQPFEAEIISVVIMQPGWYRLSLKLNEAVDVVSFDSFSAFRQQIKGIIGPEGMTKEKTSNGQPQLVLDL